MQRCTAVALLVLLCQPCYCLFKTFGSPTSTSWPSVKICVSDARRAIILNHTLSEQSVLGVMNQFWIVSQSDLVLAEMGARIEVSYHFDGETEPSVSFEPAMASGQGWAAAQLGGQWLDTCLLYTSPSPRDS